jgi:hypothetical protein
MTAIARVYTPAEAAAVSNVGLKTVHNAIDKRIVETVTRPASRHGRSSVRALTAEDLIRLKLWYGVGGILPHSALAASSRQSRHQLSHGRP